VSVVLVDSSVLLDVLTEDPRWARWSSAALERCAEQGDLAINPIVYAEVSIRFARIEELDEVLPEAAFRRLPLPWEAAFLAGKCFVRYRRRGGARRAPLPDFYIGAHAAVSGLALLTRDTSRYRSYFPALEVIGPD
jgi:predicted nucleic acid-binding protein